MGTRSTNTVGAATAIYAIVAALGSGRLSREALSNLMEVVADDLESHGAYNFRIVEGLGADDDFWIAWRERLSV